MSGPTTCPQSRTDELIEEAVAIRRALDAAVGRLEEYVTAVDREVVRRQEQRGERP